MKWMLWGRQYGKTHQTIQWFLDDPEKRVIVCGTEAMAEEIRRRIRSLTPQGVEWRDLLSANIMNAASAPGRLRHRDKVTVAVDNLEFVLPQLLANHKIELVTATGANELPPPFLVNP